MKQMMKRLFENPIVIVTLGSLVGFGFALILYIETLLIVGKHFR